MASFGLGQFGPHLTKEQDVEIEDVLTARESDLLRLVREWQETHDKKNSEALAALLSVARHLAQKLAAIK